MTFETFDVRGNNLRADEQASLQTALLAAVKYANAPSGWLTLFGLTRSRQDSFGNRHRKYSDGQRNPSVLRIRSGTS